jgi:aminoglycoside 6'-N-acetyltransferase
MLSYRFRPFTDADLPLVERWLVTAEVARWWGDPAKELALLKDDLDEPLMRQWIVEHNERPFSYVQAYEAHAWPQRHLQHLTPGTLVIDAFVGEPDMLGCGHGSAFLRLFATILITEGAPAVAIDPDVDNIRAKRAYARAGFAEAGVLQAKEGPVALMLFREDVARRHNTSLPTTRSIP